MGMGLELDKRAQSLTWTSQGYACLHEANDTTVPETSYSERHDEIFAIHDKEASECNSRRCHYI
jgi:hypothetical protein